MAGHHGGPRVRSSLSLPGLPEIADTAAPTQLVFCSKDRVFPTPRGNHYFTNHLPGDVRVIRLDGLGHIPMLEAPGRITELVADFVDQHTGAQNRPASAS